MIIELLNGTRYDISDYNLNRLFHFVPSAVIENNSISVEGRNDLITNSYFNNRIIRVEFLYSTNDIYDYYLLRDQLNDLFARTESFYIIFKREPYKRWLVRTASQFEIPPNPKMQSFFIDFLTVNNYSESIFTTSELTSRQWDINRFAWNSSITWDEIGSYSYNSLDRGNFTFESNNFSIYNGGNIIIDPSKHFLEINITGVSNTYVQIENLTTGDIYRYNGTLSSTDRLDLIGTRSLKNNSSVFSSTNRRLLTLATGQNNFVVSGLSRFQISFNFRYLYK